MTKQDVDFASPGNSREAEEHALQGLVARELRSLGLPDQSFEVQASFLTSDPMDLGIRLVWPVSIQFQGQPSGVIQIGTPLRSWRPESHCRIVFARIMTPLRLRGEVHQWVKVSAAMVREEVQKKGGVWPRQWPRLHVDHHGTVNEMTVRAGNIQRSGKLHRKLGA